MNEILLNHRCFQLTELDGKVDCYFYIGISETIKGLCHRVICRMVPNPKRSDMKPVPDKDLRQAVTEGRLELL